MNAFSRRTIRAALALGLAILPAGVAHAADSIKLADGSRVEGQAVDYDDKTRTLTFRLTNGTEKRYTLDQLDQRSVYLVTQSKVPKENAEGQLKLANYARDIGLYAHAARHYRAALAADPSIQPRLDPEVAILKREAAAFCMDHARRAVERNDFTEAEQWLHKVIDKLSDQPEAAQAQAMLDEHYARTRAEKQEKALAAAPTLQSELATGKKYYDDMVEKTKEGLTQKSIGSKSVSLWERGIKDGERALKELDKAEKKFTDTPTRETLAGYRKVVDDQIIELYMHLASHYMTRTSYNQAATQVSKALALDPSNERALSMRSRIENAAGNGWRWWW